MNIKQPNQVRGNKIRCVNYQMCPLCYGCRAYDSRDPECLGCKALDNKRGKNYNICNKDLHESWKINKIITKTSLKIDEKIEFQNQRRD